MSLIQLAFLASAMGTALSAIMTVAWQVQRHRSYGLDRRLLDLRNRHRRSTRQPRATSVRSLARRAADHGRSLVAAPGCTYPGAYP